jgi:hypothetical protein
MRSTLIAPALAAALVMTGCGGEEPTETGAAKPATQSQAMRFSACMRDNGVEGFPDPDASGELTIDGVVNGSSLDTEGAAWKEAIRACKDLEPSGFTGRRRSAGEQDRALAFADCIREHGVEDFPDPVVGEPLVNTNLIPSTSRPGGMDVLNAAMRACGDLGPQQR